MINSEFSTLLPFRWFSAASLQRLAGKHCCIKKQAAPVKVSLFLGSSCLMHGNIYPAKIYISPNATMALAILVNPAILAPLT